MTIAALAKRLLIVLLLAGLTACGHKRNLYKTTHIRYSENVTPKAEKAGSEAKAAMQR